MTWLRAVATCTSAMTEFNQREIHVGSSLFFGNIFGSRTPPGFPSRSVGRVFACHLMTAAA
jgi:hypothetical protein